MRTQSTSRRMRRVLPSCPRAAVSFAIEGALLSFVTSRGPSVERVAGIDSPHVVRLDEQEPGAWRLR
jgi:hypothetical protein